MKNKIKILFIFVFLLLASFSTSVLVYGENSINDRNNGQILIEKQDNKNISTILFSLAEVNNGVSKEEGNKIQEIEERQDKQNTIEDFNLNEDIGVDDFQTTSVLNIVTVTLLYPNGDIAQSISIDTTTYPTWGDWFVSDNFQATKPTDMEYHYFAGWCIGSFLPNSTSPTLINESTTAIIQNGDSLSAVYHGKYGATTTVGRFTQEYLDSRTSEEKGNLKISIPEKYAGNQYLNTSSGKNPLPVTKLAGYIFSPNYKNSSGLDNTIYKVKELDLSQASNLEEIGSATFSGLLELRGDFILPPSIKKTDINTFSGIGYEGTLIIPENSNLKSTSTQMFSGSNFSKIVIDSDLLETIGTSSFSFMSNLRSIDFDDSKITHISDQAFSECINLGVDSEGTVILPQGLISMGSSGSNGPFQACDSLKQIVFPTTLKLLGQNTFRGSGLSNVFVIPEFVTSLGKGIFGAHNKGPNPISTVYFESKENINYISGSDGNPFGSWSPITSPTGTLAIIMPDINTYNLRMSENVYANNFKMYKYFTYEMDIEFVLVDEDNKEYKVTEMKKLFSNSLNSGNDSIRFDFRFTKQKTAEHYKQMYPHAGEWIPDVSFTMPDPTDSIPKGYQIKNGWNGWKWENNLTSPAAVTATSAVIGTKLVMKIEKAPVYKVTYEPGLQGDFNDVVIGDVIAGTQTPVFIGVPKGKPGWAFTGWDPTPSQTVTKDATYTAQWKQEEYVVTYLPGTEGSFMKEEYIGLKYGEQTPSFSGEIVGNSDWEFDGWTPMISDKVTKNVTYVAKWKSLGNHETITPIDETEKQGNPLVPETGDNNNPYLWIMLLLISGIGLVVAIKKLRAK